MQLDKSSYLLTLSLIHQPKKKATLIARILCLSYYHFNPYLYRINGKTMLIIIAKIASPNEMKATLVLNLFV